MYDNLVVHGYSIGALKRILERYSELVAKNEFCTFGEHSYIYLTDKAKKLVVEWKFFYQYKYRIVTGYTLVLNLDQVPYESFKLSLTKLLNETLSTIQLIEPEYSFEWYFPAK